MATTAPPANNAKPDLGYYLRFLQRKVMKSTIGPAVRKMSNSKRILPTFLISGTQKGGTTFLHNNLVRHPEVLEPWTREVHYFDIEHAKGDAWYKAFFPIGGTAPSGRSFITGESSPSYMYHAKAPARMAKLLPDAKIILVLRDPASRAISHYKMGLFDGRQKLPYREAFAIEEPLLDRFIRGDEDIPYDGRNSFRSRGLYLQQLLRLERYFPKENIMVIDSNRMRVDPGGILKEVEGFLGLSEWTPSEFNPENEGKVKLDIDEDFIADLRSFFRPHNEALFNHLGWEPIWK